MKKSVVLLILVLCAFSYAKVFSYKETPPNVVYDGLWKSDCLIRLDFERRLADLSKCIVLDSAEYFDLYDKDDFWIGTYYHQENDVYKIKGGYQYISMEFNFSSSYLYNTVSVKDIKRVKLRKPVWNMSENNFKCKKKKAVILPVKHSAYEYACKVVYDCPKGFYSIDEYNCEVLPKNAQRKMYGGFECLKGFDLYADADTTYCCKHGKCSEAFIGRNSVLCNGVYIWNKKIGGWVCQKN